MIICKVAECSRAGRFEDLRVISRLTGGASGAAVVIRLENTAWALACAAALQPKLRWTKPTQIRHAARHPAAATRQVTMRCNQDWQVEPVDEADSVEVRLVNRCHELKLNGCDASRQVLPAAILPPAGTAAC